MHQQITALMEKSTLPEQYRKWPVNYFYASYLLFLKLLKTEGKEVDHHIRGKDHLHTFDCGDTYKVLLFKNNPDIFNIVIYRESKVVPDFTKNFGFDEINYTEENLLIVTFNPKIPGEVSMRTGSEKEIALPLNVFKDIPKFEKGGEFAFFFYKAFCYIHEKNFAQLADH